MSDKNTEHPEEVEFNNYIPGKFHIRASQATDYGRAYRLGIYGHVGEAVYAVENLKLKKISDDNSAFIPDAVALDKEQAQALMDTLWDAGIRPNQAKLKKLQVGALENHLSDMQKLAFEELMPIVKRLTNSQITMKELVQKMEEHLDNE